MQNAEHALIRIPILGFETAFVLKCINISIQIFHWHSTSFQPIQADELKKVQSPHLPCHIW